MKNDISYDWACEYVTPSNDGDGDIIDTDYSPKKSDVWPPKWIDCSGFVGTVPRLCVIRYSGNEDDGEVERGYAYEGDDQFCSGHTIPDSYLKQLNKLRSANNESDF